MANWASKIREEYAGRAVYKRAQRAIHFFRDDGQIEAVFTGKPLHYRDNQGQWQEIDTALVDQGGGVYGAAGVPAQILADRTVRIIDSNYTQRTTRVGLLDPTTHNFSSVFTVPVGAPEDDSLVATGKVGGANWEHRLRLTEDGLRETLTLDSKPNVPGASGKWLVLETVLEGVSFPDGWVDADSFNVDGKHFPLPRCFDVNLQAAECKRYARKIGGVQYLYTGIPVSWLAGAAYPIVIDPDFVSTSADMGIEGNNATWATARSTASGIFDGWTLSYVGNQWQASSATYEVRRCVFKFDTSSLGGDLTVIQQANIRLVAYGDYSAADFDIDVLQYNWSANDPVTNVNKDTVFDGCLSSPIDVVWRNTSGMSLNTQYSSPNLTTSWISKTGNTYYAVIDDNDYDNVDPGTTNQQSISIYMSEHATTGYRPTLVILYTASGVAHFGSTETITNAVAPYDDLNWDSTGNLYTDNGAYNSVAAASFDNGIVSYLIKVQGFGFAVPATATIHGVVVKVERYGYPGQVRDACISLLDTSSALSGDNKADTVNNWDGSPTIKTYGSTSDVWGCALTPTWVNNANFGVGIAMKSYQNDSDGFIDYVTIAITYDIDANVTSVTATTSSVVAKVPTISAASALTSVTATTSSVVANASTITGNANVAAVAAAASASAPAHSISAKALLTAVVSAASALALAAAITAGAGIGGQVAEATASCPSATITAGAEVGGQVAVASAECPSATISAGAPITSVVAEATASALSSTITAGAEVGGQIAQATAECPAPSVSAQKQVDIAGEVAQTTAQAFAPSITGGAEIAGELAAATAGCPAATITGIGNVVGVVAEASASAPSSTITAGAEVGGQIAVASAECPAPAVSAQRLVDIAGEVAQATASCPASTITAGAEVASVVATASASCPAGTITGGAEIGGDPAEASASAPSATITAGAEVSAETAEASASCPAPIVTAQQQVDVGGEVAQAIASAPSPAITAGSEVAGEVAQANAAAPSSTITGSANVSAEVALATASCPEPTITTEGTANVQAEVALATASCPAATITAGAEIAGACAAASAECPASVPTGGAEVGGEPAEADAGSGEPAPTGGAEVGGVVATASAACPEPVVTATVGTTEVLAVPAEANAEAPAPVVNGAAQIGGQSAGSSAGTPAPGVSAAANVGGEPAEAGGGAPDPGGSGDAEVGVDVAEAQAECPAPAVSISMIGCMEIADEALAAMVLADAPTDAMALSDEALAAMAISDAPTDAMALADAPTDAMVLTLDLVPVLTISDAALAAMTLTDAALATMELETVECPDI